MRQSAMIRRNKQVHSEPRWSYGRWSLTRVNTMLDKNSASLEYANWRDIPHACANVDAMVHSCGTTNPVLSLRNLRILHYLKIRKCYNTLISNFRFVIFKVIAYGWLQTKENFKIVRGCLREVIDNKRLHVCWFDWEALGISLTTGGRNPMFDCIILWTGMGCTFLRKSL